MFAPDFLEWLEGFRFPDYHLERADGQYILTFEGPWIATSMWEIPCLVDPVGAALARRPQGHGQVRAAGAVCARHDAGVGQDPTPEATAEPALGGFRHAAAARLPLAGLVRAGPAGGSGRLVHGHLELPDRHAARGRGRRHQRARAADGLRRAGPQRAGSGRRALSRLVGLAEGLRRQPADHPARHLRHARVPGARARLDRPLDRRAHRFRRSRRQCRTGHPLVEGARPGPHAEADHLLRWPRRRHDRAAVRALPGPRAHRLRLGHAADQRFSWPRGGARHRSDLDRLQGDVGQRPAGGQAVRQPLEGDRPVRRDRPLSPRLSRAAARGDAGVGVSGYPSRGPSARRIRATAPRRNCSKSPPRPHQRRGRHHR